MVIDASCIKSLGRTHQLALSSRKRRMYFCIPSWEWQFLASIGFNFPLLWSWHLCKQRDLVAVVQQVWCWEEVRDLLSLRPPHVQILGWPPKHLPLHMRIPAAGCSLPDLPVARVIIRRPVRKWSYPVRFLGGIHLALMQDICKIGVWILANDLILLL